MPERRRTANGHQHPDGYHLPTYHGPKQATCLLHTCGCPRAIPDARRVSSIDQSECRLKIVQIAELGITFGSPAQLDFNIFVTLAKVLAQGTT